ncbi:MAG: ketosteroid isomerase-like protein [Neolewinella sp.]|jgi:ketosteroid isomerase-like protein
MSNAELITSFYRAFADHDAPGMVACYAEDVVFEDPAFGQLKSQDAHDMWLMLLGRDAKPEIAFGGVSAEGETATVEWVAKYKYGAKKRLVVNEVTASFVIRDGKIVKHTDRFSMWKWSRQALGLNGLLMGWTPFLRNQVQETTKGMLKKYQG